MSDWNLVIVHHHLNPGGVTAVIRGHLESLATLPAAQRPARLGIVFDGQSLQWSLPSQSEEPLRSVEMMAVESVGYDGEQPVEPSRLERELIDVLHARGFESDDTLLHAHNHALGKNAALPVALRTLAQRGYRQLLQFHDFAEDLRPTNYRHLAERYGGVPQVAPTIYFHSDHVHFAVLNRRDAEIWDRAGLPETRLHYLPNPVIAPNLNADRRSARVLIRDQFGIEPEAPFVLYPVRGIRRKNVGELLLWGTAFRGEAFFAMTLPPRNPAEQSVYHRWVELAECNRLPVELAAATRPGIDYADLVAAADWEITTSVAEGFGLVFLESWLVGKPLLGRDLPEITADFRAAGIEFPSLQAETRIPWQWLDRDAVAASLRSHDASLRRAYGLPPRDPARFRAELEQLLSGESLDFAYLDVDLQHELLEMLATEPTARWEDFWRLNPAWPALLDPTAVDRELIRDQAQRIKQQFGLHACGRRLYDSYTRLLQSDNRSPIDPLERPERVLDSFLQLSRLHPIRLA